MYSSSSPPTCIMTNTYKVYLIKLTLLLLLCLYSGLNLETDRAYMTHAMSIVPPVLEMQPRVVGEACLSYPRVPQSRPR